MSATIYEYFSAFTKLPIRLDDVCAQAIEMGAVSEFRFAEVDIDTDHLLGMLRLYKVPGTYEPRPVVAEIYYAAAIPDEATRRLVCCKEILHVFDNDGHTAKSSGAVNALVDQVLVPPGSGITASAMSDQFGVANALMILLPREALSELVQKVQEGRMSAEDVAKLADIPEPYARLALDPLWQGILQDMD